MTAINFNSIVTDHAARPVETYRGWTVTWDYGEFTATSPNYDASYEGPEDGWVDNGERCSAKDRDSLFAEVDAWFAEHSDDEREFTPGPWNAHPAYAGEKVGTVKEGHDGAPWSFRQFMVAEGERIIARVDFQTEAPGFPVVDSLAEAEGNFRLIIAAPTLVTELRAALAYLNNAAIDLETGAPKRTALNTINGGIARIRAALSALSPEAASDARPQASAQTPTAHVVDAGVGGNREAC